MIYVYLPNKRKQFYSYIKEHWFSFKEVFDVPILSNMDSIICEDNITSIESSQQIRWSDNFELNKIRVPIWGTLSSLNMCHSIDLLWDIVVKAHSDYLEELVPSVLIDTAIDAAISTDTIETTVQVSEPSRIEKFSLSTVCKPGIQKAVEHVDQYKPGVRTRRKTISTVTLVCNGVSGSGGSTVSLFVAVDKAFKGERVCLIDLDFMSQGLTGLLAQHYDLNWTADQSVSELLGLSHFELIEVVPFMIYKLKLDNDVQLDFIACINSTMLSKIKCSKYDWSNIINTISDMYDSVVVDCGTYLTMDYQVNLFKEKHSNIFICNGKTNKDVMKFVASVIDIRFDYSVIINQMDKRLSPNMLQKHIGAWVRGYVPQDKNIEVLLKTWKTNNHPYEIISKALSQIAGD